MLHKAKNLRMLPTIARQALAIAKCPDCTIDEFASLIERDVKLATDTLRLANSAAYGARRSISSLRQAVVRLGFRQCKNLIMSSSLASLMQRITKVQKLVCETLQQHCFVTATLASHLNRGFRLGFEGEEFTAGLMHDVGRLALVACIGQPFTEVAPLSFEESGPRLAWPAWLRVVDPLTFEEAEEMLLQETAAMGTNHCELGAWYAAENCIPEELVEVVRYHHHPHLATQNRALVALTAVCDHMANHWQRFGDLEEYQPQTNLALRLLQGPNNPHLTMQFAEIARPVMETATHDAAELMAA